MLRDRCPVCLSCLSVTLVDQDATWYGGPGDIVLDGDQAPPLRKGAQQSATLRPMSIAAKRSPNSATAELLFR